MAPFASSNNPIPSSTDSADAYGTFNAAGANENSNLMQAEVRDRPSRTGRVLRTAGVTGLLMVLAAMGYTHDRSSPSPAVELQGATSNSQVADALKLGSVLSSVESKFVNGIDTTKLREQLHYYASTPHSAGTKRDYETAVHTAKQFESYGLNATLKEYYTLLSKPVRRHLAIVEPKSAAQVLNLDEGTVADDACTTEPDALPPFLAYAATGNVTASVVYANYGSRQDFQYLVDQNVTLKGKIALVRYGSAMRGLKVYAAEQHGMAGVLIYSDPHDDGYAMGSTYPNGLWRPKDSYQRGSITYLSIAGGDPLTPGFPSNLGAPYLKYEDVKTVPHIPALPLSYGQAQIILKSLRGKPAPQEWQGALSIDGGYRVGDDESTVLNLDLVMDNKIGPIWDVIGTIDGAKEPEKKVVLGNHRDAWVCGAIDPNSGTTALLEIARNLGELLETGWKPRRSIVLGSWDGEEYSLLGSTEWAEDNAADLKKHAVAYLNVDATTGFQVAASSAPSIAKFLVETSKVTPANKFFGNETETTLYEQWVKQAAAKRATYGNASTFGTLAPDHLISFMGSGSDFTPFYQHLGIISANVGFGVMYGVYHSTMDSISYVEKFADPNYAAEKATAQWWGLLGLRLADSAIIPFDFSTYSLVMEESLKGFETRLAALKLDVTTAKLHEAIILFGANAESFHATIASNANAATDATRSVWNEKLVGLERYLLTDEGLPHRPWYKHVIFGPGFYEGYMGTAFPGIDDGIVFGDNSTTIQTHVDEVARVVTKAAEYLVSA
uniref:Glutamate carboxypeptidase n=1 Tax=Globisporangium ultimum (strain ATCC 200006 / CBS 805.95 / DAOM BR144) TaxID=431595 RepID=K3WS34_GLOUD